jgi:hypothetical protein
MFLRQTRRKKDGKTHIYWTAILNLHKRIENKLFLDRTHKDSNFKRPHICATLFQIEKCCRVTASKNRTLNPSASNPPGFSASLPVSGASGWRLMPRSLR